MRLTDFDGVFRGLFDGVVNFCVVQVDLAHFVFQSRQASIDPLFLASQERVHFDGWKKNSYILHTYIHTYYIHTYIAYTYIHIHTYTKHDINTASIFTMEENKFTYIHTYIHTYI